MNKWLTFRSLFFEEEVKTSDDEVKLYRKSNDADLEVECDGSCCAKCM